MLGVFVVENENLNTEKQNTVAENLQFVQTLCFVIAAVMIIALPIKGAGRHMMQADIDLYMMLSIALFLTSRIVYLFVKRSRFTYTAIAYETKCEKTVSSGDGEGGTVTSTTYNLTYKYTVNGKEYTFTRQQSQAPASPSIAIRINKIDPELIQDSNTDKNDIIVTLVLLGILLLKLVVMMSV